MHLPGFGRTLKKKNQQLCLLKSADYEEVNLLLRKNKISFLFAQKNSLVNFSFPIF